MKESKSNQTVVTKYMTEENTVECSQLYCSAVVVHHHHYDHHNYDDNHHNGPYHHHNCWQKNGL